MIIGIDLGTTHSLVGVFQNGEVELIPNALGHLLTPSAVSVDAAGQVLVGLAARERLKTDPQRTAISFKRFMGTDKMFELGRQRFRAEELSSLVLKSLKEDAENFLGQTVTEAVVTVPAYFNQIQRRATQVAAEIAGLKVERLLNEPTAAGLAYSLQSRPDHTVFMIVDLGGGTFDVSVLEFFEGVVEVRASAGDTRLGGEDFSREIARLLIEKLPPGVASQSDLLIDSNEIWHGAENVKRALTDRETTSLEISLKGQMHTLAFTRAELETRCEPLLAKLRQPIERALMDARLDTQSIDEVILVGGATRMPMVRQMVSRLFQRLPLRTINPDETIARGAAIQAGLLARNSALDDVVLTDVMPFSLGVDVGSRSGDRLIKDIFSPIIERNTPVPVSRSSLYQTLQDHQNKISLGIYQGESPRCSENIRLGAVEITVPSLPAGEATVEVRFSYDLNGLLEVDLKDNVTQQRMHHLIYSGQKELSEVEIATSRRRLEKLKIHPRDKQENLALIEKAKRLYEDHLGEKRAVIGLLLVQFEQALESQDERQIREAREHFQSALAPLDQGPWL